jgi:hypothetical protein
MEWMVPVTTVVHWSGHQIDGWRQPSDGEILLGENRLGLISLPILGRLFMDIAVDLFQSIVILMRGVILIDIRMVSEVALIVSATAATVK